MRGKYQVNLKNKKNEELKELLSQVKGKYTQNKLEKLIDFLLSLPRQKVLEGVNALGLNSHLSSSELSYALDSPSTPKRSEEEGLPQETQSVMQQAKECYYRAIDQEKNQWYCDGTKIPKIVCIRRQQRFLNFERNCYPKDLKKKSKSRRSYRQSYEKEDSHYCVLEARPVPLDDFPLRGCFTCPNERCKQALRK